MAAIWMFCPCSFADGGTEQHQCAHPHLLTYGELHVPRHVVYAVFPVPVHTRCGYQDKQAAKPSYYAFLLIGLASLTFVHILFFVPLIWLLMAFLLQCLSWRTWVASILGLLTPYWFGCCWWAWQQDFTFVFNHFMALGDFARPLDFSLLTVPQIISLAVVMLFAVIGIVHYIRKYHDDKIRIRLIYGIFIWTDLAAALFLVLQPQHYDHLIRMMVINTAPLIGHFLALTRTRWTNMAFFAIVAIVLITTGINLWM